MKMHKSVYVLGVIYFLSGLQISGFGISEKERKKRTDALVKKYHSFEQALYKRIEANDEQTEADVEILLGKNNNINVNKRFKIIDAEGNKIAENSIALARRLDRKDIVTRIEKRIKQDTESAKSACLAGIKTATEKDAFLKIMNDGCDPEWLYDQNTYHTILTEKQRSWLNEWYATTYLPTIKSELKKTGIAKDLANLSTEYLEFTVPTKDEPSILLPEVPGSRAFGRIDATPFS